jgi:DNA polymerase-3 subunit delta'
MAFGAADLFLKTVEEPPQNTHLLLTTSRPDLLYPTLLSRTHQINVPPMPEEQMRGLLEERLGIKSAEAKYLARISGGSPGMAIQFHESDILARRELVLDFFERLSAGDSIGRLAADVQSQYSGSRFRYDDIRIDFDIIETIIHDLYLQGENRLDNHLINVDIMGQLSRITPPAKEVLEVWGNCCAQTRRACVVNNVAVDTGMVFFYISCSDAVTTLSRPRLTLP